MPSDLLEEGTPEEVFNTAYAVENDEYETESTSGFEIRKGPSDLLEEDSSEEVSKNAETVENDGNETDSALRFEIKDKLSDLLEDCSQDKGSNNTEVEDSVEITREGKASTRLPIQWEEPSLQIITSNIELEEIGEDSGCKAMNRPSTLQEVPAHKAIEAKVES